MATEKPELVFKFIDVPVQSGTYDCGLFTIAFVTALACSGGEARAVLYIYIYIYFFLPMEHVGTPPTML